MTDVPHKAIADPRTRYGDGRAETRNFTIQRVTAVANAILIFFLVYIVVTLAGADRDTMVAAVRNPWLWVPLLVMVISVPIHMRIGMREVIEDYVHEPRLNRYALMINTYFALVVGLIGVVSILKLAFWS